MIDRMEIIDVVLHSSNMSIIMCSIVCLYNIQNKSLSSVISLIKYEREKTR